MLDFILSVIIWTLALYGLIEIIKKIYYIYTTTNLKSDGIYFILAVKNQEKTIEGFLRTVLFRITYGKEEDIKKIIITDLGSTDNTPKIIDKMQKDYQYINVLEWKECKEIIDNIDSREM